MSTLFGAGAFSADGSFLAYNGCAPQRIRLDDFSGQQVAQPQKLGHPGRIGAVIHLRRVSSARSACCAARSTGRRRRRPPDRG